jgi:hypothetical protein
MKKTLALLLFAALPLLAQTSEKREPFPSDYKPSPCAANADSVCATSFDRARFADAGSTFRGFSLHTEWMDAHWDEMRAAFQPLCAKIGNCFTVPVNDWVYCVDLMYNDFLGTCDRFPADSYDHDQCRQFAMTYFIALGAKTQLYEQAQSCVREQPATGEHSLEAYMVPEKFDIHHDGAFFVYAYDAETHIPVRAWMAIDAGKLKSTEGLEPRTGYKNMWEARAKTVTNAEGHQDAVLPTMTLTAPGYKALTMPMPLEIPHLVVEMTPSADKLRVGTNVITVNVRSAETGKPVWARVMAEGMVIGEANKPIELELTKKDKSPEIWVSTLDNRYSDVVVAKREK